MTDRQFIIALLSLPLVMPILSGIVLLVSSANSSPYDSPMLVEHIALFMVMTIMMPTIILSYLLAIIPALSILRTKFSKNQILGMLFCLPLIHASILALANFAVYGTELNILATSFIAVVVGYGFVGIGFGLLFLGLKFKFIKRLLL